MKKALVAELSETVHLAVLQGREVLFLESVETPRALRVAGRVGTRLPAHATASGKALLANLPPERLREIFPEDVLPAFRPNTITARSELERQLSLVRERGYATSVDESEPEVNAVAAAIVDRAGRTRAALTLSAPVSRLGADNIERVAGVVMGAAHAVGESLA